jgi:Na+/H+ antiporter NhaD/arsenite permease-like protein
LLLGMMIVVASLRLSGFFAIATVWVMQRAGKPLILLCAVTATSGIFSAFLVNDAICLVLAPLVLELTLRMGRKPVPYLLAVAMASNVGSTATITGNPQNIMIGSFSQIPYMTFALALGPVALVGLVITVGLVAPLHREEFAGGGQVTAVKPNIRVNRVLVGRALLATAVMVAAFFAGQPPAKAAIIIGGLLLLTRRVKSERVYAEIDWSLLLVFAGLFIIVAGAQRALLTPDLVAAVGRLHLDQVPILSAVTAALSNLVSNVPAVLMMKPFVESLAHHNTAWLTIAMASTLAGNGRRAANRHHPRDRHVMDVAVTPVTKGGRFRPRSLDAINFRAVGNPLRPAAFRAPQRGYIRPNLVKAIGPVPRRGAAQAVLWSAKKLSGGSASSGVNRGSKRNRVPQ